MPAQVTRFSTNSSSVPGEPSARRDFEALARTHYENFPVGSFLVPRRLRPHVHRIYAFARTADDIADELGDAPALAAFRASFEAHLHGNRTAAEPVALFEDLCTTIAAFDLPEALFFDLLDAFAQDLEVRRYADEAALFDYCRRSADPVGRLVLRVFGHDDPDCDRLSDPICTGLQLLNHLQDIGEDLRERDRIYFPATDLERFGVDEDALRERRVASPEVRALVRHWTERTAGLFRAGWPLVDAVGGRLRVELRAILRGAAAVLEAVRRRDHDVLAQHVRLGRATRLRVVLGALWRRRMPKAFA